jgi:predicted DNA-binding protein YlxM (UPF0122 family)
MPSGYPVTMPSRDSIKALINKGLSRAELAEHYSVKWSTVRSWLRQYEIEYPGKCKLTTNELIALYTEEGFTLEEISQLSGLSPSGVGYRLRCAACKLKTPQQRISSEQKDAPFVSAGLIPVEPFIGNLTPRLCICVRCGRTVSPSRANLTRGQGGCKYCAGRVLDDQSRDRYFLAANLQPLEPYISASAPRLCRCTKCGRETRTRHNDLQQGQGGCKYCANNYEKDPGESVLRELYIDRHLATREIAQILSVSPAAVCKYLDAHGIPRRVGYEKYGCTRPKDEELEHWYALEEMTLSEIGDMCNASSSTVARWLKEANVSIRKSGSSHGIYRKKMLLANERLYHAPAFLYLVYYATDEEQYLKIGVGRENSRRLNSHRSAGAEIMQVRRGILYDCYMAEQQIRRDFRTFRCHPQNPRMVGGHTECFRVDAPIDLERYISGKDS